MPPRPRVLIVDDNPDVGRMLTLALRAHYDCFVETSATRAVDLLLGGQRFDAIVLDLWMPGTNGMEAYETIAERAPAIANRIVFITGGGLPPRMHAFAKRVEALAKPLKVDVLRAAIDRRVALSA